MSAPRPHPGPLGFLWLFFNPIGRVSREPYWLALGFLWCVFAIPMTIWLSGADISSPEAMELALANIIRNHPSMPIMLFAFQWVELALVIKRLQDKGLTGLLAILVFVPLLNVLLLFALGFLPGDRGPNAYGPGPNSRWQRPK
ncbi:DUF805 domain-containing protein [Stappia sp.]|jgi:uncharacterized membrane protein YhaH (DUF805 family)|uniref:DUF805 domain-containing protein n=1 Tax=Stappia sp. TaxID=1870903 RepID=UPI003A99B9EF